MAPPICRGCKLPILPNEAASEVAAYWTPHAKYPVHKACKTEAIKREAFECQIIDADCNDCRHFERDLTWQKREGSSGGGQPGRCLKFQKPTVAWPNTCTGHPCFEHRRSGDALTTRQGATIDHAASPAAPS